MIDVIVGCDSIITYYILLLIKLIK